ncbi:hypothetical protein [Bacillus sp. FJAT-27445]|uniref:hypothetical protein n=1 Tax=Bacillus sp. FJAT-27445 TaxID=1679166 RepID=UPI0007432F7F
MLEQKEQNNKLPNELKTVFTELEVLNHLRKASIGKKNLGFTCLYLFQLVIRIIFHQKKLVRLLESKKGDALPAKDDVYRFLNHPKFAWHRFPVSFSALTIGKVAGPQTKLL